jgi:outer membrane lipoprotein SlyB
LIDTTLELEHVTPVHGVEHTELTGNPPLQRQPVTSVLVPRLVEATKSHIAASDNETVGIVVGNVLGMLEGTEVGARDGLEVGMMLGTAEGRELGRGLGIDVGRTHSFEVD